MFDKKVTGDVFEMLDTLPKLGMKKREGQEDMALDIAEAFLEDKNVIIEAGVGIGKSYGYLIPALAINKHTRKPIIIATSSIQLSEQIYSDARTLSNRLKMDVSIAVGKGMTQYGCQARASDIFESIKGKKISPHERYLVKKVADGRIQERDDAGDNVPDVFWNKVCVQNCKHEKCSFRHECSFYTMRNTINCNFGDVDIIIVNQDLLISDTVKKFEGHRNLITNVRALTIIDEAHNLEDKVRKAMTIQHTQNQSLFKITRLERLLSYKGVLISDNVQRLKVLESYIYDLFDAVDAQIESFKTREVEDISSIERIPLNTIPELNHHDFSSAVSSLSTTLQLNSGGKGENELEDCLSFLREMYNLLRIFSGADELHLFWGNKGAVSAISYCPIDIQEVLEDALFDRGNTVLTSATLCQPSSTGEPDYTYVIDSLGFSGAKSAPKPSPFDYANNALLYVANDIPFYADNKEASLNASLERIIKLCDTTNGRTLVLFTAKEDLKYIQDNLRSRETTWEKIYQAEGSNQDRQIERFKSSGGVLFGTGIFWEGINIPGQQLSQVIIVRLPFPVPKDPVMEYKISNSTDSMNQILLPEMLIRLRQGTGRLIRQEEDKGIISILDSRLSVSKGKPYRQDVLSALPFKTTTESLERVSDFASTNL